MALLLPRVDALVACDEARLVNRYVRPLLRALTKVGATAHFFGRDWVSVKHRPAAWIGFSHERATGRAVIEAFIARETPFDVDPRASYLQKEPGTLVSIVGPVASEERLAAAITEAYAAASARLAVDGGPLPTFPESLADLPPDPPWAATIEEPIGPLSAGPDAFGRFRIGGDLLVSRDALASLEDSLLVTRDEDIGALVDASLGASRVAISGVSLPAIRKVILAARAPPPSPPPSLSETPRLSHSSPHPLPPPRAAPAPPRLA